MNYAQQFQQLITTVAARWRWPKLKEQYKRVITFYSRHILEKQLLQKRPNVQVFVHRCSMWLPWVMRHTSHLNEISSHTLRSTSSSTLITASRILSRSSLLDWAEVEHKHCPWRSPRNKFREVGWPWWSSESPSRWAHLLGNVASRKDVALRWSAVLLEQDVCYLIVLLQMGYKEQFRMSRYEVPVTVFSGKKNCS
jgi:hypothetical protein